MKQKFNKKFFGLTHIAWSFDNLSKAKINKIVKKISKKSTRKESKIIIKEEMLSFNDSKEN